MRVRPRHPASGVRRGVAGRTRLTGERARQNGPAACRDGKCTRPEGPSAHDGRSHPHAGDDLPGPPENEKARVARCGKLLDDKSGAGGARPVQPAETNGRRYAVETALSTVSAGEPPVERRRPRATEEQDDVAGCLPLLASSPPKRSNGSPERPGSSVASARSTRSRCSGS